MELHPDHRGGDVAGGHDDARPVPLDGSGQAGQRRRQLARSQGVVAGDVQRATSQDGEGGVGAPRGGDPNPHRAAVDRTDLLDVAPARLDDRLEAQADAERRNAVGECRRDQFHEAPAGARVTRPRG